MTDTLVEPPAPFAEANAPEGPLWITGGGTRPHAAVAYRRLLQTLYRQPGVMGATDLLVSAQTTPALRVNVAGGMAVIAGTDAALQGSYHVVSSATTVLDIAPGHAQYDRLDGVFAVIVDREYSLDPAAEGWHLRVVKGPEVAGGESWGDELIPPSSIWLAGIHIPAGKTSIVAADIEDWRSEATSRTVLAGTIVAHAGSIVPWGGWLLCAGSVQRRDEYPDLFAAIGTTWGAGDGSTTFALPDLRGRVLLGAGAGSGLTARAVGSLGGAEAVALDSNTMAPHYHTEVQHVHALGNHRHTGALDGSGLATVWNGSAEGAMANPNGFRITPTDKTGYPDANSSAGGPGNTDWAGAGWAHENMPPFAVVNAIIRT